MDETTFTRHAATGAVLVSGLIALTGCGAGAETVCPAIGWSNALTVALADGWPPVEGGSLTVDCAPRCGQAVVEDGAPADRDASSVPLPGSSAVLHLDMSAPESVDIRVLGADGTELTEVHAELDWRRVGGSAECGGPMEATVTVPVP
jgi:hypothetical protein